MMKTIHGFQEFVTLSQMEMQVIRKNQADLSVKETKS
jgi:hypothetical protein